MFIMMFKEENNYHQFLKITSVSQFMENMDSFYFSSNQPMCTSMATLMAYSPHLFWLLVPMGFQLLNILSIISGPSITYSWTRWPDQYFQVG